MLLGKGVGKTDPIANISGGKGEFSEGWRANREGKLAPQH